MPELDNNKDKDEFYLGSDADLAKGEKETFIRNPDDAKQVADAMKNAGMDASILVEKKLRGEGAEKTEFQQKMEELNKGLLALYPNSFEMEVGPEGETYYRLKPLFSATQKSHIRTAILTPDSILLIEYNGKYEDPTQFIQAIKNYSADELVSLSRRRNTSHEPEFQYYVSENLAYEVETKTMGDVKRTTTLTAPVIIAEKNPFDPKAKTSLLVIKEQFDRVEHQEQQRLKGSESVDDVLTVFGKLW